MHCDRHSMHRPSQQLCCTIVIASHAAYAFILQPVHAQGAVSTLFDMLCALAAFCFVSKVSLRAGVSQTLKRSYSQSELSLAVLKFQKSAILYLDSKVLYQIGRMLSTHLCLQCSIKNFLPAHQMRNGAGFLKPSFAELCYI